MFSLRSCQEEEENLATDKDVSAEDKKQSMNEDEDNDSIVTHDHESEARRSQTKPLMERQIENGMPYTMFTKQYRMTAGLE